MHAWLGDQHCKVRQLCNLLWPPACHKDLNGGYDDQPLRIGSRSVFAKAIRANRAFPKRLSFACTFILSLKFFCSCAIA